MGRFSAIRGASGPVSAQEATKTTSAAAEQARNRFPNAAAPGPVADSMRRTVTIPRAMCAASAGASSDPRSRMGASRRTTPGAP